MGIIDTKAVDAEKRKRIQEVLSKSKTERQRAVARFPVAIGLLAMDMQRLLNVNFPAPPPDSTQRIVDEMEHQIRGCYRETFGTELGQ